MKRLIQILPYTLPITDKGRRGLVAHVTGLNFATAKPFLKNCTDEETTAVAEAVEDIKARTYNLPLSG